MVHHENNSPNNNLTNKRTLYSRYIDDCFIIQVIQANIHKTWYKIYLLYIVTQYVIDGHIINNEFPPAFLTNTYQT